MKRIKLYAISVVVILLAGLVGKFAGPSIRAWADVRASELLDAYWLPRIADCIDNGGETTVLGIRRHKTITDRIVITWSEAFPERSTQEMAYTKAREHWQRLFGCALNYDRWDTLALVRVKLGIVNTLTSERPQPTATISIIMVAVREIAEASMTFGDETLFEYFIETSNEHEDKLQLDMNMEMYDYKLTSGLINRDWQKAFDRR